MKKFYLTTAIDYVNNLPHLGTAYEKIGAGVLARFLRMDGKEVHLQMGNDEHSEGVKKAAEKKKLTPKSYCDEMQKKFEEIWQQLGISYDDFVQTSEKRHHLAVEMLIRALKKDDLYKKKYEGWYCDSCEAFYTEKDLLKGECPNHKRKLRTRTPYAAPPRPQYSRGKIPHHPPSHHKAPRHRRTQPRNPTSRSS